MTVTFKCGHVQKLPREAKDAPVCSCGERVVTRVSDATPKFTGTCSGPLVEKVSA